MQIFLHTWCVCVCVRVRAPAQRADPAIEGISMWQGLEKVSWQSDPAVLCLPSIGAVCRPAAPLTPSCLSANLYRVDFTDSYWST